MAIIFPILSFTYSYEILAGNNIKKKWKISNTYCHSFTYSNQILTGNIFANYNV